MMIVLKSLIAAVGLLLLMSAEGNCRFIQAQSPEQWAVQAAVNAAGDGDIVTIPEGSATWSSPVTLSKALTIMGAGKGRTIITLDHVNGFEIDGALGDFYRIANLTFRGDCMDNGNYGAFIRITGTSQTWRVDHIHFEGTAGISRTAMIRVDGYTYGVIDNCEVTGTTAVHPFLMLFDGYVFAPQDGGTSAWRRPLSLGTANAVYLEDNEINYETFAPTSVNPLMDGHSGFRVVFRYNKVRNAHMGGHGPQTVGARGIFSWEIYENDFEFAGNAWCPLSLKGGTGVVYNNHFNAYENSITQGPICLQYQRSQAQGSGNPWLNSCDNTPEYMCNYLWGADTSESNTCSDSTPAGSCPDDSPCIQIDGNDDGTGYPCRDQIGITYNGVDDVLQFPSPAYEWDNTCDSGLWDACPDDGNANFVLHATSINHVKLNRDFFNDTQRPDYTALTYPHPLSVTDTVTIKRALYNFSRRQLLVEATSSAQPSVTLNVQGYGDLLWDATRTIYRRTFSNVAVMPSGVTVNSSDGGSAVYTGDTVKILTAQYNTSRRQLLVEATSSAQPGVTLRAQGYGNLLWDAVRNRYRRLFSFVTVKPTSVTVESTGLGSATQSVP